MALIPVLNSGQAVADLVGVPLQELTWWAWGVRRSECYRHFEVQRKNGKPRLIAAPIPPLKQIQRSLADSFTASYRPPPHVHGFTRGRSPITNASVHVGQRWVFAIDLETFFPSITRKRVRGLFESWPFEYPTEVAILLARLCCFRDALPQGAPTSPIISNFICRGMDRDLGRLAMKHRCYFSRYADDLVFSTDRSEFPTGIASYETGKALPSAALEAIVDRAGFKINERKTRMQVSFQRQLVTGLVVNEKTNVSRRYIRGLRAVLYIWKRYGRVEAARSLRRASPDSNWPPGKPLPSLEAVVRGRVQYVGSVRGWDDPAYRRLAQKLSECDAHFRPPTVVSEKPLTANLYTEGSTDMRHIRAALKNFHSQEEFLNLTLEITDETARNNDQRLKEHLEHLAQFDAPGFSVGVFDVDSEISKEATGTDGWKEFGPRVVAVGIACPPWRKEHDPRCIEMLYEDSILETRDDEGRRIYRLNEFDPVTSIHHSESSVVPHAPKGKKTLIADLVFEVGTGNQLARSKESFARAVEDEPESLPTLSFEGFRPTFERILKALSSLPVS
ncbi:MAG: reverse transcriptase domain-containing protein [Solirubrobacterales bacterium]